MVLEPRYPFERSELDGFSGFSWRPVVNQLGFVQAVDGLGQSVVVAVVLAVHRRLYVCLDQPPCVPNADVLRSPVRVANQTAIVLSLAGIQGLLQRIKKEVCAH